MLELDGRHPPRLHREVRSTGKILFPPVAIVKAFIQTNVPQTSHYQQCPRQQKQKGQCCWSQASKCMHCSMSELLLYCFGSARRKGEITEALGNLHHHYKSPLGAITGNTVHQRISQIIPHIHLTCQRRKLCNSLKM